MLGHECTHDYSDELEEAERNGYEDGAREGRKYGEWLVKDIFTSLLNAVDQRRRGAALPHPLNGETMTLDEVEEMIMKEMR
jgi:hypothetical protein